MIKIYCRFRFLNINFGPYLSAYFNFSSEKFDPPSSKSLDDIVRSNNKYYGNLLWKRVGLDIFQHNTLKVKIYGTCWILKLVCIFLLSRAVKTEKISRENFKDCILLYTDHVEVPYDRLQLDLHGHDPLLPDHNLSHERIPCFNYMPVILFDDLPCARLLRNSVKRKQFSHR